MMLYLIINPNKESEKLTDFYVCNACRNLFLNRSPEAFFSGIFGFGSCELHYEGICEEIT